ncbi:MAG: heat-inducible transcription repressor HrcA [Oscillospiraceae bacterium]|nr:heat-inducible transcription repressor HrcA [Oscillospiraceae bacterium]
MELSERKKEILRAITDVYIETAEPVGSKTIAQNSGLGLSSATIRSEMAELTALGYLEQPHTSAGRVPSAQGYRFYVNELMNRHRLSLQEAEEINRNLTHRLGQLDKMISDIGRFAAKLTSYPTYALTTTVSNLTAERFDLIFVDSNRFIIVIMLSDNSVQNRLVQLTSEVDPVTLGKLSTVFNARFTGITEGAITPELISATERATGDSSGLVSVIAGYAIEVLTSRGSGEAFVTGATRLFEHPEYQDISKARELLNYLSDGSRIMNLPAPDDNQDIKITIGPENLADELKDSSVIVVRYDLGNDAQGLIGVVGPTRMDYSTVSARLSYLARGLSWLFSGGAILPPGDTSRDNGLEDGFKK